MRKAALDATSIGPATPAPTVQPPVDIDVAGVQQALGRKGTADGGLFKCSIPRKDTIVEDGRILPPASLNLTTVVNFQPVGGGRAAINGGLQIVELQNHGLTEQPRLFYMHYWGVDDAVTLAKALRPALDATNLRAA
ncbi:hypothetical protein MSEO_47350 [Mycobacterium seoulense]|uniref:Lipoprotein LpqO n=1 Tax=Mycobacterium seoulense TaxID=386911 RepID=A0A7I7P5T8_9MYCO|nr:DUF1259 domain-containing protein [Mycobacterium seoulense]BBY04236.1 hypothetical protein MSEO_47350 [Mycobacterium seoulense]